MSISDARSRSILSAKVLNFFEINLAGLSGFSSQVRHIAMLVYGATTMRLASVMHLISSSVSGDIPISSLTSRIHFRFIAIGDTAQHQSKPLFHHSIPKVVILDTAKGVPKQ